MNKKLASILTALCLILSCSSLSAAYEFFTTDTLVEDAAKLSPEVAFFLNPAGPLSKNIGVSGSFGPLGSLGPLGSSPNNTAYWLRTLGNWEALQDGLDELANPLGRRGPYSLLSDSAQSTFSNWTSLFDNTPGGHLMRSLQAGSPLHILGSAGPLGPLAGLGPGGPNGATGFSQNSAGEFFNNEGKLVQGIEVETQDGKWKAPLYEMYKAGIDDTVESPDSFFGVESRVNRSNPVKTIGFHNDRKQWVSILLVGDYTLDDFEITLRPKGSTEVLAESHSKILSNFIVFQAPKNAEFEVDVKLKSTAHYLPSKKFRLYVSGASEKARSLKGLQPHQRKYNPKFLKFASKAKAKSCASLFQSVLGQR